MMNRAPSVKALRATFTDLTDAQVRELRTVLVRAANPATDPDYDPYKHESFTVARNLEAADKILGTYGVEYMRAADDVYCQRGASYLNTGDSYAPTILRDDVSSTVRIISTGDFQEAAERRGRRF